jgi:hypothetical protein
MKGLFGCILRQRRIGVWTLFSLHETFELGRASGLAQLAPAAWRFQRIIGCANDRSA